MFHVTQNNDIERIRMITFNNLLLINYVMLLIDPVQLT